MDARLRKPIIISLSIFALSLITSACGGGGGSSSSSGAATTIAPALYYTVRSTSSSAVRRIVTDITGSAHFELDNPTSRFNPVFSPDKQYVAYVRENRLVVMSTVSGQVRELSRFQHSAGTIQAYTWSPNSQYLAYIGDTEIESDQVVNVVNVDGSSHTQVNPTVAGASMKVELHFSPASDSLIYQSNEMDTASNIYEGFVVRIDGTEHRRFTGTISSDAISVRRFAWSPDGRYIAYTVRDSQRQSGFTGIGINTHDTTIGGRNSVRVSHDFSTHSEAVTIDKVVWSPNSNLLAYSLQVYRPAENGLSAANSSLRRLFTASPGVSGSSAETINGPMNINVEVGEWAWAPNGNYVAYEVVMLTEVASGVIRQDEGINTYDVVQGGNGDSNSVRISETTGGPLGQGVKTVDGMIWTSDSEHILYLAYIEKSNTKELYRSEPHSSENSTLLSLDVGISVQDDVDSFRLAPDGEQVAYAQRIDGVNSPYQVYLSDVLNSFDDIQLSSEPISGGQLSAPSILWSSQSTRVAYNADAAVVGQAELYVAPNDGSGSRKVSETLESDEYVFDFRFID
ncbi:hypothetical protein [Aurantivibrio plasticivorans]